jgi:Asp-tRNA(Asn)/Glu-tRNA(Gln) amidotransferase A subunit family amidase
MLDAVALSSAIHTRQLSCVEVMTAYLDHIERLNPKVNAIVALEDRDRLISQATERDAHRSISGPSGPSKMQTSTPVAWAEKTEKLASFGSVVAPRG